jgi:hypothetical protein
VLYNIDKENEEYTHVSRWFNICRNGFDTFEERLTLDNIVEENVATQARAGYNLAIDEPQSSSKRRKHRYINELC